jgi:hypothetical protein
MTDHTAEAPQSYHADDRVLIGVVTRKRDLAYARDARWYRIPYARMPDGIHADVIALFTQSAIRCYAPLRGLELVYRRDLLPDEPHHPRAGEVYYRIALGDLRACTPPIPNESRRVVTFIRTTWDRFCAARDVADLYSASPHYVDRVYYALGGRGRQPADWTRTPPARPKEWY